jgi:hypothetical protein
VVAATTYSEAYVALEAARADASRRMEDANDDADMVRWQTASNAMLAEIQQLILKGLQESNAVYTVQTDGLKAVNQELKEIRDALQAAAGVISALGKIIDLLV